MYVCACVCVYADQADQLEKDFKTSKAGERAKDKEVDEAWEKMVSLAHMKLPTLSCWIFPQMRTVFHKTVCVCVYLKLAHWQDC